jgi:iron(III) transport system ATP-binding protein
VSKRFGQMTAVDNVDLDVEQGHLYALLGPSGCGKTTLLRLIAGFEVPDAGQIELAGRVLSSPRSFLAPEQRRVAMVFQDFALFPHMSVADNVAFAVPKGTDKRRRIGELLDLAGLAGLEKRFPHELSGGQQQRVALARALAAEPALILLDEPFSNLDPLVRRRVRSEVKQLMTSVGATALFVTHDQEEALSLADQVAVMIAGRIMQTGSPSEVYGRPDNTEVAEFVGAANFLPAQAHGTAVECELGHILTPAGFSGPATLMVRAEDLVLSEAGVPAEVHSIEYFGHDQMATLRLRSGRLLKVRLQAAPILQLGQSVAVRVQGEVRAFPGGL